MLSISKSNLYSGLVGAFITGALGLGGNLYQIYANHNSMRPGHVSITQPYQSQTVPRVVQVSGDTDIPGDQALSTWLVVHVLATDDWYPQGNAPLDENHHWTCTITLGSKASSEDGRFDVLAVLVAPWAHPAFDDYVHNHLPTDASGMRNYPEKGVDVKATLHLTRDHRIRSVIPKQHPGTC